MSFHVTGDYFESCTCQVSCPCIFLGPPPRTRATSSSPGTSGVARWMASAWRNLTVLMAVHSPKLMTEGGWKAALYLDERADADQAKWTWRN